MCKNKPRHMDPFCNKIINAAETACLIVSGVLNVRHKFDNVTINPIKPVDETQRKIAVNAIMSSIGQTLKLGRLTLVQIPVEHLDIDGAYQRLETYDICKLVPIFDIEETNTIKVSYRNGHFFVIDGAHRLIAAILRGQPYLFALVYTDLTQKDEAFIFMHQDNGISSLQPIQRYKAGIVAEDEGCLALRRVTEKHNIRVATGSRKGIKLTSIQCALNILKNHNNDTAVLDWIFSMMRNAQWIYSNHCEFRALAAEYLNNLTDIYDEYIDTPNFALITDRIGKVMHEMIPADFDRYAQKNYDTNDKRCFTKKFLDEIARGVVDLQTIPQAYRRQTTT